MATFTVASGKRATYGNKTTEDTYVVNDDTKGMTLSGSANGDTIAIEGLAGEYTFRASGKTLTITSVDNPDLVIKVQLAPNGTKGVNLNFLDGQIVAKYATTGSAKGITLTGDTGSSAKVGAKAAVLADSFAPNPAVDSSSTFDDSGSTGGSGAGQTFTLTTNLDNIVGTSNNDSINGTLQFSGSGSLDASSTLTAGDQVNGGQGTDQLTITVAGSDVTSGGFTATPTLVSVEKFLVNNTSTDTADAVTFNLSLADSQLGTVGTNSSTSPGVTTSFTNLGKIADVQMAGRGILSINHSSAPVAGTADAMNVTASGVGLSLLSSGTLNVNGIETLNVASTGASNFVRLGTATATKTVNLSGSSNITFDINGATNTSVATVNASTATGNDAIIANTLAAKIAVTGGAGNDTIYRGDKLLVTDSLDGGAGTGDTLALTNDGSAAITIDSTYTNIKGIERVAVTSTALNAGTATTLNITGISSAITNVATGNVSTVVVNLGNAAVSGGTSGTFTIGLNGTTVTTGTVTTGAGAVADIGAAYVSAINAAGLGLTASFSGTALTISASNGSVGGVSVTSNAAVGTAVLGSGSITGVTGSGAAGYNLQNLANNTTLELFGGAGGNVNGTVTIGATTTTLKDATGSADAMTVQLRGTDTTANYVLTTGLQVDAGLESLAIATSGALGTTKSYNLNTISNATNLSSITISGDSNLTIAGVTASTKLTKIDASTLTGKLDLTSATTSDIAITGGSGNDTISLGTTLNNKDTIDGGAGTGDTLIATVNNLSATTGALNVSNVETLRLTATAAGTVDATNIKGANLFTVSGSNSGNTVSLTKLAAGTALGLGDQGGTAYTGIVNAALADATGTADSLTIQLNTTVAQTGATVVTTGIESLNIVGGVDPASTTGASLALDNNTLNLASSDAASIKVTATTFNGTPTINIGTLNKAVTSVDASGVKAASGATAAFTADASAATNTVTMIGGSGNNTLTGSSTKATTFTIGSAFNVNDVVTGGAAATDVLNATFSADADVNSGSKLANIETLNFTVNGGVTATYSNASDLRTAAVKAVNILGGNTNSVFKATDASNLALGGSGFSKYDASTFAGQSDLTIDKAALAVGKTFAAGSATTDALRVLLDTSSGTFAPGTISGFENVSVKSDQTGQTLNLANATGISTVFVGGNEGLTLSNVAAGTKVSIGSATANGYNGSALSVASGKTVDVQLADATGTADAVTVNLTDLAISGNVTVKGDGVENWTFAAVNASKNFGLLVSDTNANNVNLTFTGGNVSVGTNAITLASGGVQSNVRVIDASALSNQLLMADGSRVGTAAMTITGGNAADTIIMKNAADVLEGGSNTGGRDLLKVVSTNVLGGIQVDLSSTVDQITTFNGSANAAVQKGFEDINLSSYSGFGSDVTGSSGANAITATSLADVIRGGGGQDTITGGAGNDSIDISDSGTASTNSATIIFADTASNNGADTITGFKVGATASGGDILDFSAFAIDNNSTASAPGSLATVLTANPGSGTSLQGTIIRLVDIASGQDITTASGLAAAVASSGEYVNVDMTANGKAIIITSAAATSGDNYVFFATSDASTAISVTLVGTVSSVVIGDLVAGNFLI